MLHSGSLDQRTAEKKQISYRKLKKIGKHLDLGSVGVWGVIFTVNFLALYDPKAPHNYSASYWTNNFSI